MVSFRFEFPYRGNHSQFILTKLFGNTPFAELANNINGAVRDFGPALNLSITKDHSTVAILEIHSATSMREIESQVYDGDAIEVVCGIAKVRGLAGRSLEDIYHSLFAEARSFMEQRVLKAIVETDSRVHWARR